jgi:hypothetical protein
MTSRAGLYDAEFSKKSISDPELHSKGIFDFDFSATVLAAAAQVPFRSVASLMALLITETDARLAKPNAQRRTIPIQPVLPSLTIYRGALIADIDVRPEFLAAIDARVLLTATVNAMQPANADIDVRPQANADIDVRPSFCGGIGNV